MMVHAFKPLGYRGRKSVNSRLAWSKEGIPGQPVLLRGIISNKQQQDKIKGVLGTYFTEKRLRWVPAGHGTAPV